MRKVITTALIAGALIGGSTASFAAMTPKPAASMPATGATPSKAAKPMTTPSKAAKPMTTPSKAAKPMATPTK